MPLEVKCRRRDDPEQILQRRTTRAGRHAWRIGGEVANRFLVRRSLAVLATCITLRPARRNHLASSNTGTRNRCHAARGDEAAASDAFFAATHAFDSIASTAFAGIESASRLAKTRTNSIPTAAPVS